MFVSRALDVFMQRVLIVEDDATVAADLAAFVREGGGEPIGPVATSFAASAVADASDLDLAIVDMDLAGDLALPIARQLMDRDILIVWVIGDDRWFDTDDDEPTVFRREGDPKNVVRIIWR